MYKFSMIALVTTMMTAQALQGAVLFSEDFDDSAAANLRFDEASTITWGDNGVSYSDGLAKINEYNGGSGTLRTTAANNFVDDGSQTVTYAVTEVLVNNGSNHSTILARLDESGIDNGYILKHYNSGPGQAGLSLTRLSGGSSEIIFSTGANAAMESLGPNTLSIALTNTPTSVDFTLTYGVFSVSGSDTSALRVTSGVGAGLGFQNGGSPYYMRGEYDNLIVSTPTIPEPVTASMLAIGLMATIVRRRASA